MQRETSIRARWVCDIERKGYYTFQNLSEQRQRTQILNTPNAVYYSLFLYSLYKSIMSLRFRESPAIMSFSGRTRLTVRLYLAGPRIGNWPRDSGGWVFRSRNPFNGLRWDTLPISNSKIMPLVGRRALKPLAILAKGRLRQIHTACRSKRKRATIYQSYQRACW